tara:strand:+ start:2149 stop:3273 length:1125 start_codon:yes stop_codon:yes gene_type:complete
MTFKGYLGKVSINSVLICTILAVGCSGGGDEAADTTAVPDMSSPRWGHTATLLDDGRVLIVGGKAKAYGEVASAEIFDPSNNTWSLAASPTEPRGEGQNTILLGDNVLLFGGTDTNVAELYDPTSDSWTVTGNMVASRSWAPATILSDGRVLVAGGEDFSKGGRTMLDSSEIYDPSTGEWSSAGVMASIHAGHSEVFVDGKVLIVGQYNGEIYDPATDTWSVTVKTVEERALGSTATLLNNGKVLVTGGEFQQEGWGGLYGGAIVNMDGTEIYDPSSGTWVAAAPMTERRKYHSALLMKDGKVIVVGGMQIETYDPAQNVWSLAGNMRADRGELYSATLLKDGKILVVGGKVINEEDKARGLPSAEIYDPSVPE